MITFFFIIIYLGPMVLMTIVSAPERFPDVHSSRGKVAGTIAGVGSSAPHILEVLIQLAGFFSPWRKPGRNLWPPALAVSILLQLKLIQGVVRNLLQRKGEGKTTWWASHVGLGDSWQTDSNCLRTFCSAHACFLSPGGKRCLTNMYYSFCMSFCVGDVCPDQMFPRDYHYWL